MQDFETMDENDKIKVKDAFCEAICKGKLSRETCLRLGSCDDYDNFCHKLGMGIYDIKNVGDK